MAHPRHELEQLRITDGSGFRLADHDPAWIPPHMRDLSKAERRQRSEELLAASRAELDEAQGRLYADDRWSLLLVFQAMDAAGKDGTIKHVMSGVNPQGCRVTPFKQPSAEELDHDFLWRYTRALPERGMIGIFNRSYYEEVLVVRVHPEILAAQRIPALPAGHQVWDDRYEDINAFERHLGRNGTVVLKFFLHVSADEQRRRFLDRLEHPDKNWKFSAADVRERGFWDDYQRAFSDCIRATATPEAPWWVVPADRKPLMRSIVAGVVTSTLAGLGVEYPAVPESERAALAAARQALLAEGDG